MNIINNKEVKQNVETRIISFLSKRKGDWQGTMTELMTAVTRGREIEQFPGSTSSLRRVMNNMVRSFRKQGYQLSFTRATDHSRRRIVSFSRISQ